MFTPSDLAQLNARGISVEKAEKQLQTFATGFPELDIVSAASVGNGVLNPSEEDIDAYVKAWQNYLDEGHTVLKFVPASGAYRFTSKLTNVFYDSPVIQFFIKSEFIIFIIFFGITFAYLRCNHLHHFSCH